MPKSSRDLTSRERKHNLARDIAADGFIVPTKCFHCFKANKECKVDLRSGRCSECAHHGQSCNLQVTRIEYERIRKERLKVASKLEEAEQEEDAMTEKLLEQRRKIRRLRKQLHIRESHEYEARGKEEASIDDAERVEAAFLSVEPMTSMDSQSITPAPMDDQLLISPAYWGDVDSTPWRALGQADALHEEKSL